MQAIALRLVCDGTGRQSWGLTESSIVACLYSITLTLTSCINKEKVRIFFVADVIVAFFDGMLYSE